MTGSKRLKVLSTGSSDGRTTDRGAVERGGERGGHRSGERGYYEIDEEEQVEEDPMKVFAAAVAIARIG